MIHYWRFRWPSSIIGALSLLSFLVTGAIVWHYLPLRPRVVFAASEKLHALTFSFDSESILTCKMDPFTQGPVEWHDSRTGEVRGSLFENDSLLLHGHSPNGKTLVCTRNHLRGPMPIEVWDLEFKSSVLILPPHGVCFVEGFSSDGRMLVVEWADDFGERTQLVEVRLPFGDVVPIRFEPVGKFVDGVVFSPDLSSIVFNSRKLSDDIILDSMVLWDRANQIPIGGLENANALAFSANSKKLIGLRQHSTDGTFLQIWDLDGQSIRETESFFQVFKPGEEFREMPVLSPDGRMLAVTRERENKIQTTKMPFDWLDHLAKNAEARVPLVSHEIDLLELPSGTKRATLSACNKPRFSPDSQSLVTEGDDKTVQIWDCPPRRSVSWIILLPLLPPSLILGAAWLYSRRKEKARPVQIC